MGTAHVLFLRFRCELFFYCGVIAQFILHVCLCNVYAFGYNISGATVTSMKIFIRFIGNIHTQYHVNCIKSSESILNFILHFFNKPNVPIAVGERVRNSLSV